MKKLALILIVIGISFGYTYARAATRTNVTTIRAAGWYDSGNPANANSNRGGGSGAWGYHRPALTLPAGTVSKLRVYLASASFSQGIKLALYDGNGNIIGSANQPANTTGTNFWQEINLASPVVITGGSSYTIAAYFNGNGSDFAYAVLTGQPNGTSYVNFNCTAGSYNNAPCATATNEGSLTEEMYVGAFVQPGSSVTLERTNPGVGSTLSQGLLAHYSFDGANMIQNVKDTSGNGNNGNLANFTSTTTVAGKLGQALNFTGTKNVDMGDVTFMDGLTAASWSFWVKFDSVPAGSKGILSKWGDAASKSTFLITQENNEILFAAYGGSGLYQIKTTSGLNLTAGKWYHVAVTYSSPTSVIIYINNVPQSLTVTSNDSFAALNNGTASFQIGYETDELRTSMSGTLDDVRIYNRAISATEVTQLYNSGQATFQRTQTYPGSSLSKGLVGYWSFNGQDMINNVTDRSGNGNNGNLSGQTSTTTVAGKVGQGLQFDGVDDKVALAGVAVTAPFSISTWIRSDATTGTQAIISDSSTNHELLLINGTTVRLYWDGFLTSATTALNLKKWEHYVAVINADGSGTHYINGNTAGTFTGATASATFVSIGSEPSGVRFAGGLDEFRVYNRALTASEVTQLYKSGI